MPTIHHAHTFRAAAVEQLGPPGVGTWCAEPAEVAGPEPESAGATQRSVAEPAAFERANYMKALQSWKVII